MSILADAWAWATTAGSWTGPQGILSLTLDHLGMGAAAVGLAAVVALPLGVGLARLRRGGAVAVTVANVSRAIPTLALLTLFASSAVGFGDRATVIAVAIFTLPPILANAHAGVRGVDPDVREAARGQGMSRWQLMREVELPLAWPLIAAGLRTATTQAVATVPLAALVAGGGLGVVINSGIRTQRYGQALAGAVLVATLCLTVDWLMGRLERRLTPIPLRPRARATA